MQLQPGAPVHHRGVRDGAGRQEHVRPGGQSGRPQAVPVQPEPAQHGHHVHHSAEGADQSAAHRFHAVQVPDAARPDGGRDGAGDHQLRQRAGVVQLCAVLGPDRAQEAAGAGRARLLRFDPQVCVPRCGHHVPEHREGVLGAAAGRH